MIFITGDIHGEPKRFSTNSFQEQKEMTKKDYMIILGDFGLVWDYRGESEYEMYWLDWLEAKPFTTLFVDGNHENHDRLDAMPVDQWHGGTIHRIRPTVLHLMRGQVYEIEGRTFFTFGGASSHDHPDGLLEPDDPRVKEWSRDPYKVFRVNKRSWWDRELPSEKEMEEGRNNLAKAGWKVDYVLTHCASTGIAKHIDRGFEDRDILTDYLQEIRQKLTYDTWFCGHYHVDTRIGPEDVILYEQIVQLK